MAISYSLIPNISQGATNWSCKVVVLEKMSPRTAQRGLSRYQHLWLMDAQSNKIQATIFDDVNIRALRATLTPLKTYAISKAQVRPATQQMQSVIGTTQWILSGSTRITEIEEDYSLLAETYYDFTPFHQLHSHIGSTREVGVYGVVIDIAPIREIHNAWGTTSKALNVVLLDESYAITLTLWDSLAENEGSELTDMLMKRTVVVANHLKITTYNGISLSTKTGSSILINPTLQKLHHFAQWVQTYTELLLSTITSKEYAFVKSTTDSFISQDDIVQINHILERLASYRQGSEIWVNGKICLKNPTIPPYYMACSKCTKGSFANLGEVYTCIYCTNKHAICVARARCNVDIHDATGTLPASIIGCVAEQFLGNTPEQLIKNFADPSTNNISKYADVQHLILLKTGNPDPRTGDPRFNIAYIAEVSDATPPHPDISARISEDKPISDTSIPADDPISKRHAPKRSLHFLPEDSDQSTKKKVPDTNLTTEAGGSSATITADKH